MTNLRKIPTCTRIVQLAITSAKIIDVLVRTWPVIAHWIRLDLGLGNIKNVRFAEEAGADVWTEVKRFTVELLEVHAQSGTVVSVIDPLVDDVRRRQDGGPRGLRKFSGIVALK